MKWKIAYAHDNADGSVTHVNTCVSIFSLIKRDVMDSFHHGSREHLHRYADEFAFRWVNCSITNRERMEVAIDQTEGNRLTYKGVRLREQAGAAN